ncbi:MAG: hypothetical protein ACJAU9_000367 [Lentimonas sp.]|jgi:hypothetical protein
MPSTKESATKHLLCRRLVAFFKSGDITREYKFAAAITTLRSQFNDPVR